MQMARSPLRELQSNGSCRSRTGCGSRTTTTLSGCGESELLTERSPPEDMAEWVMGGGEVGGSGVQVARGGTEDVAEEENALGDVNSTNQHCRA